MLVHTDKLFRYVLCLPFVIQYLRITVMYLWPVILKKLPLSVSCCFVRFLAKG